MIEIDFGPIFEKFDKYLLIFYSLMYFNCFNTKNVHHLIKYLPGGAPAPPAPGPPWEQNTSEYIKIHQQTEFRD